MQQIQTVEPVAGGAWEIVARGCAVSEALSFLSGRHFLHFRNAAAVLPAVVRNPAVWSGDEYFHCDWVCGHYRCADAASVSVSAAVHWRLFEIVAVRSATRIPIGVATS